MSQSVWTYHLLSLVPKSKLLKAEKKKWENLINEKNMHNVKTKTYRKFQSQEKKAPTKKEKSVSADL